ncbi:MAG TPA: hypothetical protein ENI37_04295 [Chloroflexi bacterium]|nr:hypothetical protein [Chloroflexota bacterium]
MARRGRWAVGSVAVLSVALYLARSWAGGHLGFPLDDAWIHQTYARNLVEYGQWAFVPGQPSAGSTAPLWTLLLAIGYGLGLPFRTWPFALGGLCLVGTALSAARLGERLFPNHRFAPLLVGLAAALEWHLVWAAASGMETLLFALLALALWDRVVVQPARRPFLTGLLGGGLILTRPEGVLAVGLAAGAWLWLGVEAWLRSRAAREDKRQGRPRRGGPRRGGPCRGGPPCPPQSDEPPSGRASVGAGLRARPSQATTEGRATAEGRATTEGRPYIVGTVLMAAGAALVVLPYIALNLYLSGSPWPNTFYAKQAEYAALLAQPLAVRLWRVGVLPLIGAQVLLVPGLVWGLWQTARRGVRNLRGQQVTWWLPPVWAGATVAVYAVRLPVTYQHGRYLIPVIPIFLVYSIGGALGIKARSPRPKVQPLSLGLTVWALSVAVLFLAFLFLGARAYSTDVAIIEEEMVAVARWLDENTEPGALIAVHDIGAVGYFAQRPLLDLAGLVSPEVVPFIRDEERLLAWLREQDADYLVTFPSWYPTLTADPRLQEVYRTNAAVTVAQGGENMTVYAPRWDREQ